ncbi:fructuronate reductase [Sphingobium sp. AP50]|uniref:mannitol dehydrogenase family protein n=1 Tax=Sphingobium sp. AP50 TaxID=1884369 RepID=UPI0008CB7B8B|nr:mannitol dehydrogenase family protein [Sphingobium sp. AP50]SEK00481.1 fructuronate reductase [Sphingobium sp. AP50]
MTRLSSRTVEELRSEVRQPAYDRSKVTAGVVHLGVGAFHRAHQAVVFDDILAAGDLRWGIRAASLRTADVHDQMMPQDGLYHLLVSDGATTASQLIGSILDVQVAPKNPAAIVAMLASVDTHIVTLTVTEKGYKLDPVSGALLKTDPQIAHELNSLSHPCSAPGFLVAALAERRRKGIKPFTAISCDNIPSNGRRLQRAVIELAQAHDSLLARWIDEEGAFPDTMVDRIVPATIPQDIAAFASEYGLIDQAMVKTEPFTQWVIEDRFCGPRPTFPASVHLTSSVAPWEDAKLRLLNGAHSAIAYLGGLAGIAHVHETLSHSEFRIYVQQLWDEAETTLSPPAELDVATYRRALMARFDNSSLMHRTHQIAMDGSQKLPQRLLQSLVSRRSAGLPAPALTLGVAAWIRWHAGKDDLGRPHLVDDPLASELNVLFQTRTDPAGKVAAILNYPAIMPALLRDDPIFADALTSQLINLETEGAMASVRALTQGRGS